MHHDINQNGANAAFNPKDNPMVRPAISDPENIRSRWWRECVVQLTRKELADLVGVSESRIADIEAGKTRGTNAPIDAQTLQRYRLACAAVALGIEFDWLTCTMRPLAKVDITIPMVISGRE